MVREKRLKEKYIFKKKKGSDVDGDKKGKINPKVADISEASAPKKLRKDMPHKLLTLKSLPQESTTLQTNAKHLIRPKNC